MKRTGHICLIAPQIGVVSPECLQWPRFGAESVCVQAIEPQLSKIALWMRGTLGMVKPTAYFISDDSFGVLPVESTISLRGGFGRLMIRNHHKTVTLLRNSFTERSAMGRVFFYRTFHMRRWAVRRSLTPALAAPLFKELNYEKTVRDMTIQEVEQEYAALRKKTSRSGSAGARKLELIRFLMKVQENKNGK